MILVKGNSVLFELEDGRHVRPRASAGMMHDRSGRSWPRCSVLVGPYKRGGVEPEPEADARAYFGRQATIRRGEVTLPPRALSGWTPVGRVTGGRIFYFRSGTKRRGPFKHRYNRLGLSRLLFGKKRALLYKRGAFYRLEMPDGCTLDDRGFVIP